MSLRLPLVGDLRVRLPGAEAADGGGRRGGAAAGRADAGPDRQSPARRDACLEQPRSARTPRALRLAAWRRGRARASRCRSRASACGLPRPSRRPRPSPRRSASRSPCPQSRTRDAAVYALQMWAYIVMHELPYDDPARLERARARRLPDRCRPRAVRPRPDGRSSSARSRGASAPTPLDHALVYAHWAWFLQPHAAAAWILWRHPQRFPRSATHDLRGLRPRADRVLRWCRPRRRGGPRSRDASRVCGGSWPRSGERVWGRLWSPLYGFLGGNPLAAMPSLHFATSADGRAHARRDRPGGRGGRLGLRGRARVRARVPGRALRRRPRSPAPRWPRRSARPGRARPASPRRRAQVARSSGGRLRDGVGRGAPRERRAPRARA